MAQKPTYEELVQRINVFESEAIEREQTKKLLQLQHNLIVNLREKKGLKESLDAILSTIFKLEEFDSGGIYLIDEKTGALNFMAAMGLPQWFIEKVGSYAPDDSRTQLILEGTPIYLPTAQFPGPIARDLESENILSLATIPLHLRKRVIGCLNLASHTCEVVTQKSKDSIEAIIETPIGVLISQIITEEKLRENEEKFSKAFHSNASLMALSTFEDGRFIDINDEFINVLGYERDEVIGKTSVELDFFSESRDRAIIKQTVQEKGAARNIEIGVRTKNNEVRHGLFSGDVIKLQGQSCWLTVFHDITERKKAEEELRMEKDKARMYLDIAGVMLVALNGKGEVTLINQKGCEILGCPEREIVGKNWFKNFLPEWKRDEIIPVFKKLLAGEVESIEYYENPILTKSGEERIIAWHNKILKDEEGRIIGSFSSGEDITKRQKAEEELYKTKERFELALRGAKLGTWDWNIQTGEVIFDKRWVEMIGYKEGELKSHYTTWENLLHPDDKERVQTVLKQHFEEGTEYSLEFRLREKSGCWSWIYASGRVFERDRGGKPLRMTGTHLDITERKRIEEELREASKFLEKIISEAPVGMTIYDAVSGKCLAGNKAIAELIGASEEQVLAQNFYTIESWKKSGLLETANSALKDNSKKELEVNVRTTFEKDVSFYSYFVPFRTGEKRYLLFTLEDFTERKKVEEQLRQAQKMEAIGTLAGGIAHDFNNILSAVFGYTELAIDQVEKGSLLGDYLGELLSAGKRAKDLVQQILTFSRQGERELKPVRIKIVTKEAIKLLRASLPSSIEIRQNIGSDSLVMCDPTQIHQIIINLCTNAGHAMQETGGTLDIKLEDVELDSSLAAMHPDTEPGPYVQLTVSDTGHGMSKETLDRLFNPFFTTKKKGEGTGLGLSIVHGIVTSYGGTINVFSELEKGAIFTVYLPAIKKRVGVAAEIDKPILKGSGRILFVDDEQPIAKLGQLILESLGYEVTTRLSSLDALAIFKTKPEVFDLVITDMTMPNMTGELLAKELIAIRPDIPIIICTGYSTRITAEKAKRLGIRDILLKPLLKSDIAESIRKVLG